VREYRWALNHAIVRVRDKRESAQFPASATPGLGDPRPFGPFLAVQTGNNVSLDFAADHGPVSPQHYAFLVSESDFDQIYGRIRDQGLPYRYGSGKRRQGESTPAMAAGGVYWEDPSGHFREIITRPYGSGWPPGKRPGPAPAALLTIWHQNDRAQTDLRVSGCPETDTRTPCRNRTPPGANPLGEADARPSRRSE
jgi:hypothetical protein